MGIDLRHRRGMVGGGSVDAIVGWGQRPIDGDAANTCHSHFAFDRCVLC